jgi:very-short-patch-repair endonuclease
MKFVLEIDEDDADPALDRRRDASLEAVGIRILRLAAADVIADPDGAVANTYREIARRTAVFVAQKAEDFSAKFPSIVIQNT